MCVCLRGEGGYAWFRCRRCNGVFCVFMFADILALGLVVRDVEEYSRCVWLIVCGGFVLGFVL